MLEEGEKHGLMSLFNSNDFYKNDYYKIIKEKLDLKLKELYEKLAYTDQQKDQLQKILDSKNSEISAYMSECNKLKNIVELQKISLEQLQKDYVNLKNIKAASPISNEEFTNYVINEDNIQGKIENFTGSESEILLYKSQNSMNRNNLSPINCKENLILKIDPQVQESPIKVEKSNYHKYLEDQKLSSKTRSLSYESKNHMEFGRRSQLSLSNNTNQRKISRARNQES